MTALAASITATETQLCITGDIDFSNVMSLYAESLRLISNKPCYVFDFSAVTASNSAGLALIIEWLRLAQSRHQHAQFTNIPDNLLSIAKAAGLSALLA